MKHDMSQISTATEIRDAIEAAGKEDGDVDDVRHSRTIVPTLRTGSMSLDRGKHRDNGDATEGDEAQQWKRYKSVK